MYLAFAFMNDTNVRRFNIKECYLYLNNNVFTCLHVFTFIIYIFWNRVFEIFLLCFFFVDWWCNFVVLYYWWRFSYFGFWFVFCSNIQSISSLALYFVDHWSKYKYNIQRGWDQRDFVKTYSFNKIEDNWDGRGGTYIHLQEHIKQRKFVKNRQIINLIST